MKPLFTEIGARIKNLRQVYELTHSELGEAAGVHRTVIGRIENGLPVHLSTIKKIGKRLCVTFSWLNRPYLGDSPFRIARIETDSWIATNPSYISRKKIASQKDLKDPSERRRLGEYKLANALVRPLNVDLPGARLRAIVFETYHQEQEPVSEPGQILIYVLEGKIKMQVGDEIMEMGKDDAISYWANEPNLYYAIPSDWGSGAKVLEIFIPMSEKELSRRELFLESQEGTDDNR